MENRFHNKLMLHKSTKETANFKIFHQTNSDRQAKDSNWEGFISKICSLHCSVGRSFNSFSPGPSGREMTVIKCHDENRKMPLLIMLKRDLKCNSCLLCMYLPHMHTHVHAHTCFDLFQHKKTFIFGINVFANPAKTLRLMWRLLLLSLCSLFKLFNNAHILTVNTEIKYWHPGKKHISTNSERAFSVTLTLLLVTLNTPARLQ